MTPSKVIYKQKLPSLPGAGTLLIYDQKIITSNVFFERWSKKFANQLPVQGGEDLKDLRRFPAYVEKVLRQTAGVGGSSLTVVAVGGGSVGDFAGFLASVLKRGVRFVQIPSTWLAAIDSAHGGKTALNLPPFKNQIGSFYPAEKIFLIRELLANQPSDLARQALAELAKMALLQGGRFWQELSRASGGADTVAENLMWKFLKPAVEAKWKVVRQDPFETKGIRHVLNLGHTFGHFIEGHYRLSHGESVGQGLLFALQWSRDLGLMSEISYSRIQEHLAYLGITRRKLRLASAKNCERLLLQDKKAVGRRRVKFIFLARPGRPVIQAVSVSDIVRQARRHGWVR